MKSGANMLGFAPNPSIWSLVKGPLCARVSVFVLIGMLLLAASAHAAASGAEPAGEASSQAPVVEPAVEVSSPAPAESAPEGSSPAAPVTEPTPEISSPASVEPAPEGSSPAAPVVEPSPEVSSPPPAEPAPEVSSPTPVEPAPEVSSPAPAAPAPEASSPVDPVVEKVQEVLSPAEPVVEQVKEALAPATPVAESTPEVSSAVGSSKEVAEVSAGKPILEHDAEGLSSAGSPPDSAAPEVSGAMVGPVTTILPSAPEELSTALAASSAYAAALASKGIAQRAVAFARELGGLGASPLYTQTVGLEVHSLISVALVEGLAMGKVGRARARAGGGSDGSPGGSAPIAPQPGPGPGGAFGGAAGGGSGIALSGFPTFAGHLLMGAPLAMRRLRLSFRPWLTAFFVLIPERPG
jgi:hypothetical protein